MSAEVGKPHELAADWTDEEWLRVLHEFPPTADVREVAEQVKQWRREAAEQ